ncbi:MAG: hypothetical protein JW871_08175 [Endomicrobiales bacterium]|nr:hypothetical protein [Endomicrobiales bacterium]
MLNFLSVILISFAIGLVFSTYNQCDTYFHDLLAKSEIAVFVERSTNVTPEVLGERILNINGVKAIDFVSSDRIIKEAKEKNPRINKILVAGDNPFSPYFIVKTKIVNLSFIESLEETIAKLNGVDEIRYDKNLMLVVEKLDNFLIFYRFVIRISLFFFALLLISKLLWLWLHQMTTVKKIFFLAVGGAVSGLLGSGAYYLASAKIFALDVVKLPPFYIFYFMTFGVLMALLWEN